MENQFHDPVGWVFRLLDVNDGSGFPPEQKAIINKALTDLLNQLQTPASDKSLLHSQSTGDNK